VCGVGDVYVMVERKNHDNSLSFGAVFYVRPNNGTSNYTPTHVSRPAS